MKEIYANRLSDFPLDQFGIRAFCTRCEHQLPFEDTTEVFGSERLTGALLDRLTHQVQVPEVNGEIYRINQSRRRRERRNKPSAS